MDNGFRILERLINATNARHRYLTSNIANADTPGYKAKDVKFSDYVAGETASIKVVTTSPAHMQPGGAGSGPDVTIESTGQWGDGNNVELDMEIAKMTENGLLNQAGVRLLSAKMRMYRNALKRQ